MGITRAWLGERKACGPDLDVVIREFGEDVQLTRANFERALSLGLNLLWLGCHLADRKTLSEFIVFTLGQREPALAALTAVPLPEDAPALRLRAVEAWGRWRRDSDLRARSEAIALREAARDQGLAATATAAQAEEAALAALRAISFTTGESATAQRDQLEWLAERALEK